MQNSPTAFARNVAISITRGAHIGGDYFPPAKGKESG